MFDFSRITRFWRLPLNNFWQQRSEKSSPKRVEDSTSLRVLVLALVIVAIVAIDIAAETKYSLWGLPLSIVGAIWSYYHRHQRNITIKFFIAIGMLVALGAFFGRLVGHFNDTRLVLAQLLIQLQILHSFDLPRRKDLGYSVTIGLILLGVAASVSQTLAFAPILLIFLAIALPTLVFDYRSRLGLGDFKTKTQELKFRVRQKPGSLPSYFLLFILIIGLGLSIFAVLPRFPGYQLRNFPVSSPIKIKENLTGKRIYNPGYVRQGKDNDLGSNGKFGQGKIGKPGKIDDSFYYGFNSSINQNLRGKMTPKVVMRVRSQVEGFWRVLAFDRYTGKGWEITRDDQVKTIKRSPWSYKTLLSLGNFLTPTKEVVQTYTVVSDLPNVIPAMAYPREIYFPTPTVAVDPEGSLRSPVGLSEGLTYTVISEVPYRDRTILRKASTKYPDRIKKSYLQIPESIAEKIKSRTEEILANYNRDLVGKSDNTLNSTYEKALYLAQYLKQNYTIPDNPLNLPYLGEREDLVEAFLFRYKGGYPDHFSTVLTVMLRSIGIPTRLVAGFSSGSFNPFTGMYVVRNTDAYAMTEVYFPKYGWFAFDPIPSHPLIPPSIEKTQTFTVLRQFWNWVAGWLPSPVTGWLNYIFEVIFASITYFFSWLINLFFQGWFGVFTVLFLAIGVTLFSWFSWLLWKYWCNQITLNKLPPMERQYQKMLLLMAKKGVNKHSAQTSLEYAQVISTYYSPAIAALIEDICRNYVKWRYGSYNPDVDQIQQKLEQLQRDVEDISQDLKRN
ncbi:DUF3488 and DUF4129 domain-containing transglutaminase family protein [Mastigocoleus sp. MO_188.B34]|uniref:DUF3488 and transglutaminase-like domain-containing protein n=1 Tax=Mastigocoleus sp. MO_188.B34 TaxID=3036635 RepID=UPI0026102AE1|nr:DUF3488 and DUF4129 domain-containing transglutaminase family protein [Mastigocoleus sp. MO_188.B34]MDJ0697707.1 DUF3488 and DUF4129 domain-containing transglutaminase family protein [Mastigocoleus sp. MO_188.B34]